MLAAQRLELSLLMLAALYLPDHEPAATGLGKAAEALFKKTAGGLKSAIPWPDDDPLIEDVEAAVNTRNALAHHYLAEHEMQLNSPEGDARRHMLRNLREITERFRDVDGRVDARAHAVAGEHGWDLDDPKLMQEAHDAFITVQQERETD